MSIIISEGHWQTAEVEFAGKHPDIFSTYLAAKIVQELAKESQRRKQIEKFRADLNVQSLASDYMKGTVTPVQISIGGQVCVPDDIGINEIADIADSACVSLLEEAGYFKDGDFSKKYVAANLNGISTQAANLNGTTQNNKFADSCVVYGHYLQEPYGIDGTFPSLIIAKQIDSCIDDIAKSQGFEKVLRPDGKVHVTVEYTKEGFVVDSVYLSVSHSREKKPDYSRLLERIIERMEKINVHGLKEPMQRERFYINAGGDFDEYFLMADAGVSKAKDDIIITGGIHQLGTDRVWGKCLYKASSTLIPYAFSLSRAVCEATGAKYASVSAYSRYGQREAHLQLEDIDSIFEKHRSNVNRALNRMPKDRDSMRTILGLNVNMQSYNIFNDVAGFHGQDKPWKRKNEELLDLFAKNYS